ncbi:hypothetical protein AXG55_01325 [Silvanigrella aquatica]|uniref:Uncharacterized protein n=1 Tax=Silvanigrella aquatica TaxID=1915309 RepID=A0A1L4CXG0_9BACT|nr:hypothetical protein AXG55_01325 [Silvanigrella aquatica]
MFLYINSVIKELTIIEFIYMLSTFLFLTCIIFFLIMLVIVRIVVLPSIEKRHEINFIIPFMSEGIFRINVAAHVATFVFNRFVFQKFIKNNNTEIVKYYYTSLHIRQMKYHIKNESKLNIILCFITVFSIYLFFLFFFIAYYCHNNK